MEKKYYDLFLMYGDTTVAYIRKYPTETYSQFAIVDGEFKVSTNEVVWKSGDDPAVLVEYINGAREIYAEKLY